MICGPANALASVIAARSEQNPLPSAQIPSPGATSCESAGVFTKNFVGVGVNVGVEVAVFVAVFVGVGVSVFVAVGVSVFVAVGVGVAHGIVVDELRGTGAVTTSKSLLLLFVSWQPPTLRTPPWVDVRAAPLLTDVPPSPLPAVPFPAAPQATQSTIYVSCVASQGVAVAPQVLSGSRPVTRATLPFVPDIFKLPVIASGVTGKAAPALPAVPSWTR